MKHDQARPETTTTGKYQIWLSPKAARFAAAACDHLANGHCDDENDNGLYRAIAAEIRKCMKEQKL